VHGLALEAHHDAPGAVHERQLRHVHREDDLREQLEPQELGRARVLSGQRASTKEGDRVSETSARERKRRKLLAGERATRTQEKEVLAGERATREKQVVGVLARSSSPLRSRRFAHTPSAR
jgi:hypothetical protein